MKAVPVPITWHPGLPIFASESFLKVVGDEYGWIGGIDNSGKLRCILPYTVIRKSVFRMIRFRVETIPLGDGLDVREEKSFLNSVVGYLWAMLTRVQKPVSLEFVSFRRKEQMQWLKKYFKNFFIQPFISGFQ